MYSLHYVSVEEHFVRQVPLQKLQMKLLQLRDDLGGLEALKVFFFLLKKPNEREALLLVQYKPPLPNEKLPLQIRL